MDARAGTEGIPIRELSSGEFVRLAEIDRMEEIRIGYRMTEGELERMDVDWDTPNWFPTGGEHSVSRLVDFLRELHGLGAVTFGALDGERLVAIATWRPNLTETTDQLALLHVNAGHRRCGIATRLFERVEELSRGNGASVLYVSATPSESAVGFYASRGFTPTDNPHPALFALEPDDIHMIKELIV